MVVFMVSIKAILFRCMLWQIVQKISGQSLQRVILMRLVNVTENLSVMDPSMTQARQRTLYVGGLNVILSGNCK